MKISLTQILLNMLEVMPIRVTELPVTPFSEDVTLMRLYELVDEGRIEFHMEENDLGYIRVFTKRGELRMKRYVIEHYGLVKCPNGGLVKYVDLKAKIDARLKHFNDNYPKEYFLIVKRELRRILEHFNDNLEEIPKNRCDRCGGSGYDPIMEEEMVYTRSGDVDVQYSPVVCRLCEGTCVREF